MASKDLKPKSRLGKAHPGRVKAIISVKAPRPRNVTSLEFNRVQREVLDLLSPEIDRGRA